MKAWWRAAGQRDFVYGVLNGLFFTLAETLTDPNLVLVAFVSQLTDSPFLIGLVAPLRDSGWLLPQLWVSGYVQSLTYKLWVHRVVSVIRLTAWAAMAAAPLVLDTPAALLAAFFLAYGAYALSSGLSGLAFVEVVGKTIPPHRRVVFFAWRLFLGGLAALGAAELVRRVLSAEGPLAFPYNFVLLFGVGWAWAALGLWVFQLIDEPAETRVQPAAAPWVQARRAWGIVRTDRQFRRFLLMRASLLAAGAAVPFFAVHVRSQAGDVLDLVGVYLAVYTVASLTANVTFGRLAGRLGQRGILVVGALAGLLMMAVVAGLLAAEGLGWLAGGAVASGILPAFALAGVRDSGLGIAGQPLLLEVAPADQRSLYLGTTNTLLGVVLLTTGLSGLVVQAFGFAALTALTLTAHLVGFWLAVRLARPGFAAG